jgi:hypothetical protein
MGFSCSEDLEEKQIKAAGKKGKAKRLSKLN